MELIANFEPYICTDKLIVILSKDNNEIKYYQSMIIKYISKQKETIILNKCDIKYDLHNILEWKILDRTVLFICYNENSSEDELFSLFDSVLNNRTNDCIFVTENYTTFENYERKSKIKPRHFYVVQVSKTKFNLKFFEDAYDDPPYCTYECICNCKSPQIKTTTEKEISCILYNYLLYLVTSHQIPKSSIKNLFNKIAFVKCFPENKLKITASMDDGKIPNYFFKSELWIGALKGIDKLILLRAFKIYSSFLNKHLLYEKSPEVLQAYEKLKIMEKHKF